jgi:hypothetical protein
MRPRRPRTCLFCAARPTTDEHLIARWIGRMYARQATVSHSITASGLARTRVEGGVTFQLRRVVCAACNGGWMSALHREAKPLIEAMINGDRVVLGPSYQALAVDWSTMLAMLAEWCDDEGPGPFFTQDQRVVFRASCLARLAADRPLPTLGRALWFGACPKGSRVWLSQKYLRASTTPKDSGAHFGHSLTAMFGHLVLQLVSVVPDPNLALAIDRRDAELFVWRDRLVRARAMPVAWPPRSVITHSRFEQLAERWVTAPAA